MGLRALRPDCGQRVVGHRGRWEHKDHVEYSSHLRLHWRDKKTCSMGPAMTGHRWLSLRMPAVAVAECCESEIAGNRVLEHYNTPAHCFWDDSAHDRLGDLPRPLLWKRSSY